MDDRESGKLIGDAFQHIKIYSSIKKMYYQIGVIVKDGRYKYEITNLRYQDYRADASKVPAETHFVDGYYKNGKTKPFSDKYRRATMEELQSLIASLEASMRGNHAAAKEDFDPDAGIDMIYAPTTIPPKAGKPPGVMRRLSCIGG
jgi:hypothetical protein